MGVRVGMINVYDYYNIINVLMLCIFEVYRVCIHTPYTLQICLCLISVTNFTSYIPPLFLSVGSLQVGRYGRCEAGRHSSHQVAGCQTAAKF